MYGSHTGGWNARKYYDHECLCTSWQYQSIFPGMNRVDDIQVTCSIDMGWVMQLDEACLLDYITCRCEKFGFPKKKKK